MPAVGQIFKVDASEYQRLALAIQDAGRKTPKALRLALNRAGDMATTAVKKRLTHEVGLKLSKLTRGSAGLRVQRVYSDSKRQEYSLSAKSAFTPLSYFDPKQTPAGVTANPWGRRQLFAGTFLVTFASGHQEVFKRVSKANRGVGNRLSGLEELWGPSLARELGRPPTVEVFRTTALANVGPRLTHEVSRLMPKRP